MHPELKIDSTLRDVMSGQEECEMKVEPFNNRHSTKQQVETKAKKSTNNNKKGPKMSLRVVLTAHDESQLNEFLDYATKLNSNSFQINYEKNQKLGRRLSVIVNVFHCHKIMEIASLLAKRKEVTWVERVHPAFTHNRWARGVCDTGNQASQPLSVNFTGVDEIVGIADTGIDMKNCYFIDPDETPAYVSLDQASSSTPNLNHRKVVQYITYADALDDSDGHGTHVSGSVAGRCINDYGDYVKYNGMAEDAKISFFDIGDEESDVFSNDNLIVPSNLNTQMFSVLYESGARIMSNSWGTSSNLYDFNAINVDDFMWENPDALVLFSAGNSGLSGLNSVGSPATMKNGIAVGASLNDHDSWLAYENVAQYPDEYNINSVAYFSSRGPTEDGRLKPDILAPGWWTTSSRGEFNTTGDLCEVTGLRGTSMACPTAAGFAVKVRQYFNLGYYPSGKMTPSDAFTPSGALLKAVLVHSGRPMSYLVYDTRTFESISSSDYPSYTQGYGRIQMSAVLNFGVNSTLDPLSLFVLGDASSNGANYASISSSSDEDTYSFKVATADPVRVTLCYTDLPGENRQNVMINLLHVRVVLDSTGTVFTPYLLEANETSNTQVIDIANPSVNSQYTVRVFSESLSAEQPYALVITGGRLEYLSDVSSEEEVEDYFRADNQLDDMDKYYIGILSGLILFLLVFILYVRGISHRKSSILKDPRNFQGGGDYMEGDEIPEHLKGGRQGVMATIRNIRNQSKPKPAT